MIVRQIRSTDGTGTLSYLVAHSGTSSCAVIDPNIEDVERIRKEAAELGARITHVIDTHTHADHVSGAEELKKSEGSEVIMHEKTKDKWKIVDQGDKFGIGDILRANAKIPIDRYVEDNDTIAIGPLNLKVLHTPGHTDNHIALQVEQCLFTGDLLLIGQAGRSDLPGGNPEEQYESLKNKVLPLPDATKIYPGHDYEENEFSYLGDERKNNPFLKVRSREAYREFVKEFFPPFAEATEAGGKMTLQCGTARVAQRSDTFLNTIARDLAKLLQSGSKPFLLDVREPAELMTTGAIEGVFNIPLGILPKRTNELPKDKSTQIVCICASGSRSFEAAHYLHQQGFRNVVSLEGGTLGWIREGYSVVKPRQIA